MADPILTGPIKIRQGGREGSSLLFKQQNSTPPPSCVYTYLLLFLNHLAPINARIIIIIINSPGGNYPLHQDEHGGHTGCLMATENEEEREITIFI